MGFRLPVQLWRDTASFTGTRKLSKPIVVMFEENPVLYLRLPTNKLKSFSYSPIEPLDKFAYLWRFSLTESLLHCLNLSTILLVFFLDLSCSASFVLAGVELK